MDPKEPLVLTFVPALVVLLLRAEQQKGAPLTEHEVNCIRDKGACVAPPRSEAIAVAQKRGYDDLDAAHAWEHWQVVRTQLVFRMIQRPDDVVVRPGRSSDLKLVVLRRPPRDARLANSLAGFDSTQNTRSHSQHSHQIRSPLRSSPQRTANQHCQKGV